MVQKTLLRFMILNGHFQFLFNVSYTMIFWLWVPLKCVLGFLRQYGTLIIDNKEKKALAGVCVASQWHLLIHTTSKHTGGISLSKPTLVSAVLK